MKKAKGPGDEFWREIRPTKPTCQNTNYNFRSYHSFGNSYGRITAVKWDTYDVENTAGKAR